MLKKTITYKDLDDKEVTEDFYFNLTVAEIAELQLSKEDGFVEYLKKLVASKNGGEIISTFKMILVKSVGRRSEDGRRFMKNDEVTADFMETNAYSSLFMELLGEDGVGMAEFIRGIVPSDLAVELTDEKLAEAAAEAGTTPEQPAWIRENREPTQAELQKMSPEQLREAFARKNAMTGTP